ncbi:MAG TPA: AI-2E family transporter [Bryobacteraceae bacterium]|nr:AI-2E family transporter [Bryobacteraceae bacterium]
MSAADRTFARRILIALTLLGVAALVCYTANLLLLVFAAILGAILLNAAVLWVCARTHLKHEFSYLLVLFAVIAVVGIGSWLLIPRVVLQLSQLSAALPEGLKNAQKWLNGTEAGRVVASHSSTLFNGIASRISHFGFEAVDALVALAIAVVLSAYFAANPTGYEEGMLRLIPPDRRRKTSRVFRDVASTMGWWMIGQLVPMAVLGIVSTVGLLIIGVPLAFTLGLFTGIMIFIPFVGAIIAFIVTTLVAVSSDPSKVLPVAIIFFVIHILEGYILTPLVQKRAVHLPPALTILSQVLMTTLFGFMGLVLATPITAGGLVLVKRIYLEKPVESPGFGSLSADVK